MTAGCETAAATAGWFRTRESLRSCATLRRSRDASAVSLQPPEMARVFVAMKTRSASFEVHQQVPWVGLLGIFAIVAMTLGNAAANMLPMKVPTAADRQRAAQAETAAVRKQRIATMTAAGDRCRPALAIELARQLVFDGQSARPYTDDFARRCGEIESVARWGAIAPPLSASARPARPSRSRP